MVFIEDVKKTFNVSINRKKKGLRNKIVHISDQVVNLLYVIKSDRFHNLFFLEFIALFVDRNTLRLSHICWLFIKFMLVFLSFLLSYQFTFVYS